MNKTRGQDWPATRSSASAERSLFDAPEIEPPYLGQRDTGRDIRRFGRQCQAILDRLRKGPASNQELAGMCLKYGGRISDLRKAGFKIECRDHDHKTGRAWYHLIDCPAESR